jgi:soluble lytic murein transglycosylase-like protein
MKYIKWLWTNHFEKVMAILAAIAFIGGMIVAAVLCAKEDNKREEAVNAYLSHSVVESAEPSEPIVVEETRKYFDVPLSEEVQERIFDECEKHDLSPAVVVAMIERESKYDTYALGDDGRSFGLMQIMAKWHLQRMIDLNCTDLFDPCQNVTVGIDILAEQMDRYDGDIAKALTAYNRGYYNGTITEYATSVLEQAKKIEYSVKGE